MARAVTHYIEDIDASDQLVSPLFGELAELPPLFIQVGESEILLDDATWLAKRLTGAGVAVEIDIWPDVPHMWQLASFRGTFGLPEERRAVADISRFLKRKMGDLES
jgi:acetyl esterase/lipase